MTFAQTLTQFPVRLRRGLWIFVSIVLVVPFLVERVPAEFPEGEPQGRDQLQIEPHPVPTKPASGGEGSDGCLHCHDGVEDMHPWLALSCVDCHGGDASTKNKLEAHVLSTSDRDTDERLAPLTKDLSWRRFKNPSDLRVIGVTCGTCHGESCKDLLLSLHGTTAGHLSDGFYEIGQISEKGSLFGVFPVPGHLTDEGAVDRLVQPPAFSTSDDPKRLASHFPDLVRKECMQCHLWSEGRGLRGRTGFDGDYRGAGCAACHVPYASTGLSDSADRSITKTEPGHPRRHVMTAAPSTQTCVTCHYGDASIGLQFRGLSQLPPNSAGGPDIEGTTDVRLNRTFYVNDNSLTPPDVHHEFGMHCVDCHGRGDVMGDGALHGSMEDAVAISCESCHGTFDARASMTTARGEALTNVWLDGDKVLLKSKVTGKTHTVKQVMDVIDPEHPDHIPAAMGAMNGNHGKLECYACHAGWNVNFLGFHFYRNESLTQMDLISGRRTKGRVTTQEKVFASWKSFYAGLNEKGRIAPYMTGFATMGTVDGEDGTRILDQVMPETAAGLSGMTMIHHQMHTTRPTARGCVECHRSGGTWGLGTSNFKLGRQIAFVADRRGIEAVALNRQNLAGSIPLGKFVLPDVVDLELDCDPLQGYGQILYASEGGRGIHVFDVSDPRAFNRLAFIETISPRGMAKAGDYLFIADGIGGLRVVDISDPAAPKAVGQLPLFDAQEVEVRWPYAYVADGIGGMAIVDIREPIRPRLVSGVSWKVAAGETMSAIDLDLLFQYSRPQVLRGDVPAPYRSDARNLCAVVDENVGLILIDVTEPSHPEVVYPSTSRRTRAAQRPGGLFRGLALRSKVDPAPPQGGKPASETDYVYLLEERTQGNGDQVSFMRSIDVGNPKLPRVVDSLRVEGSSESMFHLAIYNQPFLQPLALIAGDEGVSVVDLSNSEGLESGGVLMSIRNAYAIAVEEFPLDAMIDPSGRRLKDVSHEGSRWLLPREVERILDVPGEILGTIKDGEEAPPIPGHSARLFFARYDVSRDGLLTGQELQRAGSVLDRNGDGRVTLAEAADVGQLFKKPKTSVPESSRVVFGETRTDPDGDLARLLDGQDGRIHDRDRDGRLDRKEMSRALFAALDLNGDGRLNRGELSRHPGKARQIRYGDEGALDAFSRRDLNNGGTIAIREFNILDPEWDALDLDSDGGVQLPVPRKERSRNNAGQGLPSEWPVRRARAIPLPPLLEEGALAAFDKNGDTDLTRRELRDREDLLDMADGDYSGLLERGEWMRLEAAARGGPVDSLADSFLARWDLDGSGEVEEAELPSFARPILLQRGKRR